MWYALLYLYNLVICYIDDKKVILREMIKGGDLYESIREILTCKHRV